MTIIIIQSFMTAAGLQHMMNIFQVNQSRFDEKISQILPHKTSNTCDDNILLTVSTFIKQLETKMLIWSWEVAPSWSRVEELFRECNIIQDPTRAAEQRFYVKTDTADRKLKTVLHLCVRQPDSDWAKHSQFLSIFSHLVCVKNVKVSKVKLARKIDC